MKPAELAARFTAMVGKATGCPAAWEQHPGELTGPEKVAIVKGTAELLDEMLIGDVKAAAAAK